MLRLNAAIRNISTISPVKRKTITFLPVIWYASLPLTYLLTWFGEPFASLFNRDTSPAFWDFALLIPFWVMLIIILECSPYFVVIDLANLLARGLHLRKKAVWQRSQAIAKIVLISTITIYVSYRNWVDTYHGTPRHQKI